MTIQDKGNELIRLHREPTLLQVINVWDVISAKVIADLDGTTALATASHSIAASYGYPDGEQIPVDLMIEAIGRIAAATELPVTADLEAGYGNAGETTRKAIDVGIVGANLEDEMKPLAEAVAAVEAVVTAADSAGVPFALNARTDAFVKGAGRELDDILADAIERGQAYLAAGATSIFVPGPLSEESISRLVEAYGPQKLTVIGIPGAVPAPAVLQDLGVARISYGPFTQRLALTALADAAVELLAGGTLPTTIRNLN